MTEQEARYYRAHDLCRAAWAARQPQMVLEGWTRMVDELDRCGDDRGFHAAAPVEPADHTAYSPLAREAGSTYGTPSTPRTARADGAHEGCPASRHLTLNGGTQ